MHRTIRVPIRVLSGLLSALVFSNLAIIGAQAQDSLPPPRSAPTPSSLIVPINGTQRLQMGKRQVIAKAVNEKETIARVSPVVGDPTTVLITGLDPGITRITLVDEKGNQEVFEVVVQMDVEFLRNLIRRAVPTANVVPIPGANNTIILTGTVARVEEINIILQTTQGVVLGPNRIINNMRVGGVMQVQLDVVIARVARTCLRQMGFNFLISGTNAVFGSNVGGLVPIGTVGPAFGGASAGGSGVALSSGLVSVNPGSAPTNLFLAIVAPGSGVFNLLQLLRTEQLAKLLAEPRLVTLSGRPATFLSGGDQAVPIVSGFGGTAGVQFVPFGTRVTFLPVVLGDGKIYLDVEPEVSQLDAANGTPLPGTNNGIVPGRQTQRVQTTVLIEDGQTFVLGGLIQTNKQASAVKVPVLGELPYVGALFSTKSFQDIEEELVILVTPHLVDPMDCSQLTKLLPGQETRNPDDFELFLEGILEAPRGQRVVYPNHHYMAAYKNGPSANVYPCAANGRCGAGNPYGPGAAPGCQAPSYGLPPNADGPMAPPPMNGAPGNEILPGSNPAAPVPDAAGMPAGRPATLPTPSPQ